MEPDGLDDSVSSETGDTTVGIHSEAEVSEGLGG
jgi:hypothetical protein